MPSIKLLKEPGFIYDLSFIFYLNFNAEEFAESYSNIENVSGFVENVLWQFGEVPEELRIFFRPHKNGRTFFTEHYFTPYRSVFSSQYGFAFLQRELEDQDRLVKNMICYYLRELSEEEQERCFHSAAELFARIKASDYTAEEKSMLYEFFIDPASYIQTLQAELKKKNDLLTVYYEKNYQKILDAFNNTSFADLEAQLDQIYDLSDFRDSELNFCVSYCLVCKYCMSFHSTEAFVVCLLGADYTDILEDAREKSKEPDLQAFGHSLSDEGRVRILDLLLERGEITRKDLELLFSFSGSTAYHHITLMLNAGLIKTRNQGKTIIYSLNREFFDRLIKTLRKYSTDI